MDGQDAGTKVVRQLRGGQITIPAEFRKRLGINESSLLQMRLDHGELRITPLRTTAGQGSAWLKELYDYYAPIRQEAIDKGYTEEEINQAIDEAVAEVRQRGHRSPRD